jgi:peptidoglycan-associated lipoprotein
MKYISFVLVSVMIALFSGCAPKVIAPQSGPATPIVSGNEEQTIQIDKKPGGGIVEEDLTTKAERDRLLRERQRQELERGQGEETRNLFKDIRFEYDSYAVRAEELPRLKEVGRWLDNHKSANLSAEGHCDERGTQEYNLMLGQKRAEAVKDQLSRLGVDEKRIKAVSYGKEAPLDPGHTEDAWGANRRVHLKID